MAENADKHFATLHADDIYQPRLGIWNLCCWAFCCLSNKVKDHLSLQYTSKPNTVYVNVYNQEQKTALEESIENQLAEIVKLQKELERLKNVETKMMKEKQKTKEQEKTIAKLEATLVETKAELDKTQVRPEYFIYFRLIAE